MILHWKALDIEITDFEYHHHRKRSSEILYFKKLRLMRAEQ